MLRNVRIMPCVSSSSYGRRKRGKGMMWRRFRGLVKVIGSLTASLGLHTDNKVQLERLWEEGACVCGVG